MAGGGRSPENGYLRWVDVTGERRSGAGRAVDWLFRNRATGGITVAQAPNALLVVFLLAAGARWLLHPSGAVGTAVDVVASVALIAWAVDEIVRGVNPWRRILGGGVLLGVVIGALVH